MDHGLTHVLIETGSSYSLRRFIVMLYAISPGSIAFTEYHFRIWCFHDCLIHLNLVVSTVDKCCLHRLHFHMNITCILPDLGTQNICESHLSCILETVHCYEVCHLFGGYNDTLRNIKFWNFFDWLPISNYAVLSLIRLFTFLVIRTHFEIFLWPL